MYLSDRDKDFGWFLLIIICGLAFIPAIFIPWTKGVAVDYYNYVEVSSGFFLRALKVILFAISIITWIVLLYLKFVQDYDENENNEDSK